MTSIMYMREADDLEKQMFLKRRSYSKVSDSCYISETVPAKRNMFTKETLLVFMQAVLEQERGRKIFHVEIDGKTAVFGLVRENIVIVA